jgi:hypothetical protein
MSVAERKVVAPAIAGRSLNRIETLDEPKEENGSLRTPRRHRNHQKSLTVEMLWVA